MKGKDMKFNIKYHWGIDVILLIAGLGGTYILRVLQMPTTHPFINQVLLIISIIIAALGGVSLFLRLFK
jgi:hypothetical protein